jgi:glycosyltransferase involved in cell wall biosynthesis
LPEPRKTISLASSPVGELVSRASLSSKTSVVIPAHNEAKGIADCLAHVLENTPADLLEILVVDNASTDGTAAIASRFDKVRVMHEPEKGLTRARQCGLLEARGELLAYIDADCHMPDWWFPMAAREFGDDPGLVCLSGPYIYYDLPYWQQKASELYWGTIARPVAATTGFMAVGGNFIAKKDALLAMGGFDKTIEFYGEDTDIARRLSAHGKVKFLPSFAMPTSGRRLAAEGFFRIGIRYSINYAWVALFKRPFSHRYQDIR